MKATLKAEVQKLLTVRSTYFTSILALLLVIFFAFYILGYRGISPASGATGGPVSPTILREVIINSASTAAGFAAIVAVLFMVHEYRYNIIMHTLTAARSRSKVLLAKVLTITVYAVIFAVICAAAGVISYRLGLALRGAELVPQTIDVFNTFGKALFYTVGTVLVGLLFGALVRNIVLAIAVLLLAPNTVEPLLGLALKDNSVYLPFAALERVVLQPGTPTLIQGALSPGKAMLVFSVYLAAGWFVTWLLFLRRDAS